MSTRRPVICWTATDSTPHGLEPPHRPPGAPSTLRIALADAGVADFGRCSSAIDTPHVGRLAVGGAAVRRLRRHLDVQHHARRRAARASYHRRPEP